MVERRFSFGLYGVAFLVLVSQVGYSMGLLFRIGYAIMNVVLKRFRKVVFHWSLHAAIASGISAQQYTHVRRATALPLLLPSANMQLRSSSPVSTRNRVDACIRLRLLQLDIPADCFDHNPCCCSGFPVPTSTQPMPVPCPLRRLQGFQFTQFRPCPSRPL